MSGSSRKDFGGRAVGGRGGGIDEDEDEIDGPTRRDYQKEESEHTCEGKRASLFKFKNAKKKLALPERWSRRRKKKKKSGEVVNSGSLMKMVGGCLCLKKPLVLDSSGESPTSDPNSPKFTYGMLRSFIEKNDFYDRDCNPHLE